MNTNEILSHIDSLLKESRLDEAEKYMKPLFPMRKNRTAPI